jgi:hypothetical protein
MGKKKPPWQAVFWNLLELVFAATCTGRYSTAFGLELLK